MTPIEQLAIVEKAQAEITKIHPLFASVKAVMAEYNQGNHLVQDEQNNWTMYIDPLVLDHFTTNELVHLMHDVYHLFEDTLEALNMLPPDSDTNVTLH